MKTTTKDQRLAMAAFILSVEARRKGGKLAVYKLPAADGGGSFEVAGINDRYHPQMALRLAGLIERGKHEQAEAAVIEYLANYTDVVTNWTRVPALEAFLRDCAFNRGPKGALRILQIALWVADDGRWGPVTRGALAAMTDHEHRVRNLLVALRAARQAYERRVAPPVGARAKFWAGLVNRWDKALEFARTLL
jgi:hypothetical protein